MVCIHGSIKLYLWVPGRDISSWDSTNIICWTNTSDAGAAFPLRASKSSSTLKRSAERLRSAEKAAELTSSKSAQEVY